MSLFGLLQKIYHSTVYCLNSTRLRSLAVFKQFEGDRKAAIRSAKAVRSLGERQLRKRLHGWPAFFLVQYAGVRAIAIGSERLHVN